MLLSPEWVIVFSLLYIGFLFMVARRGDRQPANPKLQPYIYALTLATFCTSWTFYGSIEQFSATGWWVSPMHIGAALLFIVGWRFMDHLVRVGKRENATTIADFVAARYGHSRNLAALVAIISLIGIIPYIALQLKAVSVSFSLLTSTDYVLTSWWQDQAFYVALAMAMFSIAFGTRHVDTSEHHQGLMHVIALESVIKLAVYLVLGYFAVFVVFDGPLHIIEQAVEVPEIRKTVGEFDTTYVFLTHILLGVFAIFCLPRQFHVAVVENQGPQDQKVARWMFPLYLLLINLFTQMMAMGGQLYFGTGSGNNAYFSLLLPMQEGYDWLALLAYIGGLSAGTSMVIIASITLSSMLSNELLMPLAIRTGMLDPGKSTIGKSVLTMRRVGIVLILLVAYAYFRVLAEYTALVSIGMLSMVAVAQFAPSILLGVWSSKFNRRGALIGLSLGFATWFYTLVIPVLAKAELIDSNIMQGFWGLSMLRPETLFGLTISDSVVHGTFWSLLANVLGLIFGSLSYREQLVDQLQAARFVDVDSMPQPARAQSSTISVGDVYGVLQRFVREDKVRDLLAAYTNPQTGRLVDDKIADEDLLQRTERLLGSVIGAPASRLLLDALVDGRGVSSGRLTIVDEASHMLEFSRDILSSALQSIEQGISIVDRDLNIVAWNRQYEVLFPYPEGLLQVGQPVERLIRYRAEQGDLGDKTVEESVEKRLQHLSKGKPYIFEREQLCGRVLEIKGSPMPGGGYITTYTDITERRRYEDKLQHTNERLEENVEERTRELVRVNQQLQAANANKTRFLAAAGHDLVQPLNSAALFTSSLIHKLQKYDGRAELVSTAEQLEQSLENAESLLSELLEISKLDAEVVQPSFQSVSLDSLIDSLHTEFSVLAQDKQLDFRVEAPAIKVHSDTGMLRRVLQNLLSNAFRYTPKGFVELKVKARDDQVAIEVWDSGIGISESHQEIIFEEFQRIPNTLPKQERGLGLGLAIVSRMCKLLGHPIEVESKSGQGACFTILMKRAHAASGNEAITALQTPLNPAAGQHILCIDNEPSIVEGMSRLLEDWGYKVSVGVDESSARAALAGRIPDLIVVDYHLENGVTGLQVMQGFAQEYRGPCIVITADYTEEVERGVALRGYKLLKKPVRPLALRSLIAEVLSQKHRAAG